MKSWRWLRRAFLLAAVGAALVLARSTDWFLAFGGTPHGERLLRMKRSIAWEGDRFRSGSTTLWWNLLADAFATDAPVDIPRVRFDPATEPSRDLRVTWLGHATVLVEIEGRRVLTDPVWSRRASPSSLVGPERNFAVPLELDRVPRLDAVVISHDHYAHLDASTARSIASTGVPFFVPLGVGAHLEKWGVPRVQIHELDWWEEESAAGGALTLVAMPAAHHSGRGVLDRNRTLWASWGILGVRHRVLFAGDTDEFAGLEEIGEVHGPFDVALVGGAAARAPNSVAAVRAAKLLPIAWGTFGVRGRPWNELPQALVSRGDARVLVPRPGESVTPARHRTRVWWD